MRSLLKKDVVLVCAAAALCAAPLMAASYSNEAAWRTAAPGWVAESFDGIATATELSSLPALGITFDLLNDGVHHPSVQTNSGSFGGSNHTAPNVLFNAVIAELPGLGPIVIRPATAGNVITAAGCWNTGGDDSVTIEFRDASNGLIESTSSPTTQAFVGIVNTTGAASVRIVPAGGNGFFSIDDLQVVTAQGAGVAQEVPALAPVGLVLLAALVCGAGLCFLRRA